MIKTLAIANKSECVRVRVPHSVQQSIPIRRIYTNGIWEVGRKHSRSWRLTDVNYIAASDETQRNIFKSYCAALNSLPTDATAKITIVNHRLNPAEFERRILLPYKDDWLDHYREEANAIMLGRAAQSNNLVQERFLTLSIPQRKISESRAYFRRAGANLQKTFARLDSGITPANNYDRLRILHDFFRPGYEQYFDYDDYLYMQSGKDFRDLICPDSISFKRNHFEFGNRFGRVLFLRTYASFVTDDFISDLTEYVRDLILSIDMIPVPTDEAVKEVESIILGVDTDITRWQQRQNSRNNFTAEVPRTMEQKRENSRGFMDDLTQNDQRMIFSLITLVHTADSLEELDADTEKPDRHWQGAPLRYFFGPFPAGGRAEHRFALRPSASPRPAHSHHRELRRGDPVPGAGDPGPRRPALRNQRDLQESACLRPAEADQSSRICSGRDRLRQERGYEVPDPERGACH